MRWSVSGLTPRRSRGVAVRNGPGGARAPKKRGPRRPDPAAPDPRRAGARPLPAVGGRGVCRVRPVWGRGH